MATTYYMKFVNQTSDGWHFGVYQTFPDAVGLESVVWKEEGVPTGGQVQISWTMDYGVSITNFDGKNVSAKQIVSAKLGNGYQVVISDDIIGISPTPISSQPADIVALINKTNPATPVNMGFALSGSIIASHSSAVGGSNYQVHPKYYRNLL